MSHFGATVKIGTTAPSYPVAGMLWADTSAGTVALKIRNKANGAWTAVDSTGATSQEVAAVTGVLTNLTTTAKGTLVAAINELDTRVKALETV